MFKNADAKKFSDSMDRMKKGGEDIPSTVVVSIRFDIRDLAILVQNYTAIGIDITSIGGGARLFLHDYAQALKQVAIEKGEPVDFSTTEEAIRFLRRTGLSFQLAPIKAKVQMEKENRALDASRRFNKIDPTIEELARQAEEKLSEGGVDDILGSDE